MQIKIKTRGGTLPTYETQGSAGMDVRAVLTESILLQPGQRSLIPTDLFLQLPEGYEAQIRARSGLAVKHGIGLVNGVGTIDSDYRGEIKVPLINWGEEAFRIEHGDRIAQIVVAKYERVEWVSTEALEDTARGIGGFGHTGTE